MPNDYIKKEPSKTEKMLYQLAMNQRDMDRHIMSNSAQILALGVALGVDPEKIAKLLTTDEEKLKEHGKKINEAIQKLAPKDKEHDYSHEGHNHGEEK